MEQVKIGKIPSSAFLSKKQKEAMMPWSPKIDTSGLGPCCIKLIRAKVKSKDDEKVGRTFVCPGDEGNGCAAVIEYHHGQWQLKYFWSGQMKLRG